MIENAMNYFNNIKYTTKNPSIAEIKIKIFLNSVTESKKMLRVRIPFKVAMMLLKY